MADTTIFYRFTLRGGTAADLATVNEIPLGRELIVEVDTKKLKLGDGVTRYNVLPYLSLGGGSSDAVDVAYDNTVSGLVAEDLQAAVDELVEMIEAGGGGGGGDAADVTYSNASSGLASGNVQDAIDELAEFVGAGGGDPGDDPHAAYVTSLLKFDGGEAVATFTDVMPGISWLTVGLALQRTAAAKFGPTGMRTYTNGAAAMNGGTAVGSGHPAYIGAGDDFTAELWVKPDAAGSSYRDLLVMRATDNGLLLNGSTGASTFVWYESGTQLSIPATLGVWSHVAVVRKAGSLRIYVNGVPATGSYASTSVYDRIRIGQNNSGSEQFQGDVDEFRLTKWARYDGAFTPPTEPFPIPVAGPVGRSLPAFVKSDLPPALTNAAVLIYVTDLTGGAEPCISDGTNWRRLSDRSVAD